MQHTGAILAADLYRLLMAARIRLPGMAEEYLEANRTIARTADVDTTAFTTRSRVAPVWKELRDEYQRILGRTAENLISTGNALERVVEYYARTDEVAAAELKRLIAKSKDPRSRQRRCAELPVPQMPEE